MLDLACIDYRKKIIFEEVMITLCLFKGYQPHTFPKKPNFSHKAVI